MPLRPLHPASPEGEPLPTGRPNVASPAVGSDARPLDTCVVYSPGERLPDTPTSGGTYTPQPRCLNCGRRPLTTNYCPDCGQDNIPYPAPLLVLLREMAEELIKWDGRLVRTLAALLLRPGFFTREYNAGRRVHYLSPFRLYLAVSFLAILIIGWQIQFAIQLPLPEEEKIGPAQIETRGGLKINSSLKPPAPSEDEDTVGFNDKKLFSPGNMWKGRKVERGDYLQAYESWQRNPKNKHRMQGWEDKLSRGILKAMDAPVNFLVSLIQSMAKAMFFLMPFYALLLSGLFRQKKRYYVEHLVFAVNGHTVAFTLILLADSLPNNWILPTILLLLSYWVHEFRALRAVYEQPFWRTLGKQWLLNQVYGFILFLGLILSAFVTLLLP